MAEGRRSQTQSQTFQAKPSNRELGKLLCTYSPIKMCQLYAAQKLKRLKNKKDDEKKMTIYEQLRMEQHRPQRKFLKSHPPRSFLKFYNHGICAFLHSFSDCFSLSLNTSELCPSAQLIRLRQEITDLIKKETPESKCMINIRRVNGHFVVLIKHPLSVDPGLKLLDSYRGNVSVVFEEHSDEHFIDLY
jgi:hypothetical protein